MKRISIILAVVLCGIIFCGALAWGGEYFYGKFFATKDDLMNSFKKAGINWKQFEGETITFLGNSEPNQESIMKLVPIFEELTGIKVTHELVNEENLRQKITIDLTGKTGVYDAMLLDPGYISLYVKSDSLDDLGLYLNDAALTDQKWYQWPSDFPENFIKIGQVKDVQYGLPLHLSGTLMIYRKDIYQEKGIPGPAKTFDELMDYASKLNQPDDYYGIAMRGMAGAGLNMFIWTTFLKSFGGKWWDENWKPTLDSPESISSVKFYSDILKKYGPPGVSSWEWSKILSGLQTGKVTTAIDTPAFAISIENPELSKSAGKWGYAPQPAGKAGITMDPYSWYVGINKDSQHKKAAWLFMTWMTSKEVQMAIGGPT
ncbi:MAG: sugar ABC transporter substrate-binding protein, partial [Candidatus Atribacteria bacterium]|nr:sugar ABC transporter substrate-binding protein [Candidatus Atribacteria bacterium]